MKLSTEPTVHPTAKLTKSTLGRYTEVGERTKLNEVSMGDYSYVVNDSDIAYATIGKCVSIAAMTRINPGNHPMQRATQAHFTYRASHYFEGATDEEAFFDWRRSYHITIGHDVWIGHGVIILPGNSIGTGAVIGAGAVVTKPVPDYAIVVGNPARTIRQRFSDEIVADLKALRVWDWSHEQLHAALDDLRQLPVEAFITKYASIPHIP